MITVILIIFLGFLVFFSITPLRNRKRNSKYFAWLWWIVEMKAIVYVTGAFLLLVFIVGLTALNHYVFKVNRTEKELNVIKNEIEQYYTMNSEYPKNVKQIIRNNPLKRDWLTDNWGNLYEYSFQPDYFEVRSAGRDKKFHTDDDLTVSDK